MRHAAETARATLVVVADLAGEKFRLGVFENAPTITATAGSRVRLILGETSAPSGENLALPIPSARFFSLIRRGSTITVGDGAASLVVTHTSAHEAEGELTRDGTINQKRGLTIRGSDFQPRSLTPKDMQDLEHVCSSEVYDVLALSFVASESDVLLAKRELRRAGRHIPVVAKIETAAGLENLDSICRVADMLMAARGDLALAIPWVELPAAVHRISEAAARAGIPWILATQVAEGVDRMSMPTRSEICDLAHWRLKGCAGVLLSYETAFGDHPVQSVACISQLMERWSLSVRDREGGGNPQREPVAK